MPKASIFVSHSSKDKPFAVKLVAALRTADLDPWIDREKILVGSSIIEEIGHGLTTMDLLVLIVSSASMESGWVQREAEYATHREVREKKTLVLPFIIDNTQIKDLPWVLQTRNISVIAPTSNGIKQIVNSVRQKLELRESPSTGVSKPHFEPFPDVESIIKGRTLGDWAAAEEGALTLLTKTDAQGHNNLLKSLLRYKDADDQEKVMNALAIVEMCAAIAPWIIDRSDIFELANHDDFTVRSSAASICMQLANVEPTRVPVDILINLSRFDEDWYVQAPANAALKTMAHTISGVLLIFVGRLNSAQPEEREHAASQLFDISEEEPEILDLDVLNAALVSLKKLNDEAATELIKKVLANVKDIKHKPRLRYGL